MIALIISIGGSLFFSLIFTRILIRSLTKRQMGQFVRQDGPETHLIKRGTPTMGGVSIIFSAIIGYFLAALSMYLMLGRTPKISSVLVLGLMVCMGIVGFIDDFAKIRQQQSLGLSPVVKMIGQGIVGIVFAVLLTMFRNDVGLTPGSTQVSFLGDTGFDWMQFGQIAGFILFVIWINFIITAWTNAVNLTDGLDGLATGVSLFAFAPYIIICFWQFRHVCEGVSEVVGTDTLDSLSNICYNVRDPWDLTLVVGAIVGALFGFLWWNTSPAKIFMGDTGSLALGGAFAALSILTHTELLAIIIGGVFVVECVSDVLQVGYFKLSRKMGWKRRRIFKMAPIHHHFEMLGWKEHNVVVRFWIISALCAACGIGIFYASWVQGATF